MIAIKCAASPLQGLPIQELLRQLNFVPFDYRERAGVAFFFPFNSDFDDALQPLSLMERVPEMQNIGITSSWRVTRWCTWLAVGIRRALAGRVITFYDYHLADKTTQFFVTILAQHLPAGGVCLMPGSGATEVSSSCILAEHEQRLVFLLEQPVHTISHDDVQWLIAMAQRCVERAQYWQAEAIYAVLRLSGQAVGYHGLGLVQRFYASFEAAEWYLQQASIGYEKEHNPVGRILSLYAISLLHLRFHHKIDQSVDRARECIALARQALVAAPVSLGDYIYTEALIMAADGLLAYRQHDFVTAIRLCDAIFEHIANLPASERKEYVTVFTMANKARVLGKMECYDEAASLLCAITERDPHMSFWWIEYVEVLCKLNRYVAAVNAARTGLQIHPDCPLLQQLLTDALSAAQRHAAVVEDQCSELVL